MLSNYSSENVDKDLVALREYLSEPPVSAVAMPALGCGNGGLKWDLVKPMIVEYLSGLDSVINVYEPFR